MPFDNRYRFKRIFGNDVSDPPKQMNMAQSANLTRSGKTLEAVKRAFDFYKFVFAVLAFAALLGGHAVYVLGVSFNFLILYIVGGIIWTIGWFLLWIAIVLKFGYWYADVPKLEGRQFGFISDSIYSIGVAFFLIVTAVLGAITRILFDIDGTEQILLGILFLIGWAVICVIANNILMGCGWSLVINMFLYAIAAVFIIVGYIVIGFAINIGTTHVIIGLVLIGVGFLMFAIFLSFNMEFAQSFLMGQRAAIDSGKMQELTYRGDQQTAEQADIASHAIMIQ
jgi:hypothetical protein